MEIDFFIVRFLITQNMPNLQVPFFRQAKIIIAETPQHMQSTTRKYGRKNKFKFRPEKVFLLSYT